MTFQTKHISSKLPIFLFLFLFFLSTTTVAQVKFFTTVNEKEVALNQYVHVQYTIENARSIESFKFPAFKQFRIVQGPIQSTGASVINGVMSQYKEISFILQPILPGKFKIPSASAIVDGMLMRSNYLLLNKRKALPKT